MESWITFVSARTGRNLLYKMRPDGSELGPIFGGPLSNVPGLSEGMTLYREPHLSLQSPDGALFLSWARDVGLPEEKYPTLPRFMLYLGRTSGGQVRVLAPDSTEAFAWAPDGRRVAYSRPLGRDVRTVTGLGSRLASTQVLVVGTDGTNEEVVLEKPGSWGVQDWSPDGEKLLLVYHSAPSYRYGTGTIIEFDLVGASRQKGREEQVRPGLDFASSPFVEPSLRLLTPDQPGFYGVAQYSPDGEWIAANLSRHQQRPGSKYPDFGELVRIGVVDATLGTIAKYPAGQIGSLCWSPNGSKIVFARCIGPDERREAVQDGCEIWEIGLDGTEARLITTGWSPDWRLGWAFRPKLP